MCNARVASIVFAAILAVSCSEFAVFAGACAVPLATAAAEARPSPQPPPSAAAAAAAAAA